MRDVNIYRVDLNLLIVFDAIARTRSVTAAAELLSLSQPAVSHALKRLRRALDDPIFVRGRNGLVLTPRVERSAGEVRAILAAIAGVLGNTHFVPSDTKRVFTFAASDYALTTIVPHVARRLRKAAPAATIEVTGVDPGLIGKLEAGAVDLAFIGEPVAAAGINTQELFKEHFVGLVCRSHPLAARAAKSRVTLAQYLAHPHTAVSFGGPGRSPIDITLAAMGKARRIAMVTPSFGGNLASIRGTDLVVSLPSRLATAIDQRGLVLFRLPFDVPDYPYFMGWHGRSDSDEGHVWLRNLVVSSVTTLVKPRPPS